MNNSTYITIQSWMRSSLGLSGNELLVYAVIYGFSQDGESRFTGNRQYLADWCGCTVRSIQTILNNLVEKGLIIKYENTANNIKHCEYVAIFTSGEKISPPSEKNSLNNIVDNKIDSIEDNIIFDNKENGKTDYDTHAYSDEELQSDFLGSVQKKPKVKKRSLYAKCTDEIQAYTNNVVLQSALSSYLSVRLSIKEKPMYSVNQWKALLTRLTKTAQESSQGETVENLVDIVQQSTEKGWCSFYPIKTGTYNNNVFSEGDGVYCESSQDTAEERGDKLKKKGRRSVF